MNESELNKFRRIVWMGASLILAGTMLFIADGKGLFRNSDTRVFELSVFFGAWLAVTLLLRAFMKSVRSADDISLEALWKRKNPDDRPKK